MTQLTAILNFSQVTIEHIDASDTVVNITLHSETGEAHCPLCSQPAIRVQSRYHRTIQDLPLQGKTLRLGCMSVASSVTIRFASARCLQNAFRN